MQAFKINEIPKGKSVEVITPDADALDLNGLEYRNLQITVNFEKRESAIQVDFTFITEVKLICDRSLDEFWQELTGTYSILFKEGTEFETEDVQMSVRRLDISGNIINIGDEVRDTILLSVPLKKVHPRYFDENGELKELELNEDKSDQIDPRWEALRSLQEKINNN
jgi:uncharacterized metal-binding protein YceD (DUF177 family)